MQTISLSVRLDPTDLALCAKFLASQGQRASSYSDLIRTTVRGFARMVESAGHSRPATEEEVQEAFASVLPNQKEISLASLSLSEANQGDLTAKLSQILGEAE